MGTTDDYSTGRVLENIRKALHVFDSTEGSLNNNEQAVRIQKKIQEFEPRILSFPEASVYIRKASIIALGERVCRALHPGSVSTESVFLDELAEAMISSGQARLASIEDAELRYSPFVGQYFRSTKVVQAASGACRFLA